MKKLNVFLPVILIVLLLISWYSFLSGTFKTTIEYNSYIKEAKASIKDGLYEQAIEFYKDALSVKKSVGIYRDIKSTYDTLYKEEHIPFIRNAYISDMALAATDFPNQDEFWNTQIKLYIEANNYTKAYETAVQAKNMNVSGKEFDKLYKELLYMTKIDYKLYSKFYTALNGYITVYDGNEWLVLGDDGKELIGPYKLIGLLNDDGKGLYINNIDTRILDKNEIARARFKLDVEEAGCYSESSDLIPVKIKDKWKYVNSKGKLLKGEYDVAGSFYNKKAVAKKDNKWYLIDEKGNETKLDFQDIKLDLYGSYIQSGIILAKKGGNYHIYDADFKQIGDFSASNVDICISSNLIAFEKGGKWGFANKEGKVEIEPAYDGAKSFANGYAAVKNDGGLWGFINSNNELVIDYKYFDAFYFTSSETCMISEADGCYQLLQFKFD
ncbi:MAG: WG repeat-containing protein [Ruminococcaceae bacterium]|nr:WG repeat-containing protein [Oscillospiraceae bacterium]